MIKEQKGSRKQRIRITCETTVNTATHFVNYKQEKENRNAAESRWLSGSQVR